MLFFLACAAPDPLTQITGDVLNPKTTIPDTLVQEAPDAIEFDWSRVTEDIWCQGVSGPLTIRVRRFDGVAVGTLASVVFGGDDYLGDLTAYAEPTSTGATSARLESITESGATLPVAEVLVEDPADTWAVWLATGKEIDADFVLVETFTPSAASTNTRVELQDPCGGE